MSRLAACLPQVDHNLVEAVRQFNRWQEAGLLLEEEGLLFASGTSDFPVGYSNCVLRVDPAVEAGLVLERAADFFGEQERGYTLWVREHLDADLGDAAAEAGLTAVASAPWMVLDTSPGPEPPLEQGVELAWVQTDADVADVVRVNREAYQALAFPPEEVDQIYGVPRRIRCVDSATVLARVDGEPVATAMALVTDRVVGVYWVGTRESRRRRGLGALCTRAVARAGFERGAEVAALQASPLGESVYRKLGFETISAHRWLVAQP